MPINLLIDTCNLRKLVSKTEFGINLLQLELLTKQKYITLLAPDILQKEWEKHREEEKNMILKSLKPLENDLRKKKLLQEESVEFLQEKYEDAKRLLNSQLDVIDDLLTNHSIPLPASEETIILIYKQRKENKMPFGNTKKDNFNDAEIIFTALDYLQRINEKELYFISDNKSEFAFNTEPNLILHPEIVNVFPTITTHYFTNIADAFIIFDQLNLPRFKKQTESTSNKIRNTIYVDKGTPILHQVHQYLEKRFSELVVIPKELFTEHYPFIINKTFSYGHKPFTLITDNEKVFELFTKVEINAGVVKTASDTLIKDLDDEKK